MPIITPIPRDERRQMQKATHKTCDKNYARRLIAMRMLHGVSGSVMLPERSVAPVHPLDAGLTGSRCRVRKAWNPYLQNAPDAGLLSISAPCYVN